jgi:hypothetical protein
MRLEYVLVASPFEDPYELALEEFGSDAGNAHQVIKRVRCMEDKTTGGT